MRKLIKIAVLLVLVIGIAYFALHPEITGFTSKEKQAAARVDKDVEGVLEKEGSVEVVIFLKEPKSTGVLSEMGDKKAILKSIKENAKIAQEEFEESSPVKLGHKYSTMSAVSANISEKELSELKNDNNIERIAYMRPLKITLQNSVPYMKADVIHAMNVNGININGSGQTICIIDTGVDYTHPDLGGCTNDTFLAGNCPKVIGGHDFVNNDSDPMDDNGHGTSVAGVIAASGGITGIAPGAKIVALKACPASGTNCNGILSSIDWCISNAAVYNITIISMSLGVDNTNPGYCDDDLSVIEKPFIDLAIANNLPFVIASGNEGHNTSISSPACLKNSTSVGAVYHFNASSVTYDLCSDSNVTPDSVPCYSNTANILDFVAPGSLINTTALGAGYDGTSSGTSLSTPHLTGIIILLNQYLNLTGNRRFSPSEIESILKQSGDYVTDQRNGLNFSKPNLLNTINNFILTINDSEKSINNDYGKAILNTTDSIENASLMFTIGNKSIFLNSSQYPQFDVSANIIFYNLGYLKTPIILRDGIPCPDCQILGYDGNLTFYVPHFTNYSVTANSRLIIFDENDAEGGLMNRSNIENTLFFANYTNATDNSPISSAVCNITFSDNASAVYAMAFNASDGFYYYAKNFSNPGNYNYNVSCSDNDFEPINLSDSITSLPGCGLPPPNIDWVIPENSTTECNNTILYFQNQTLITKANSTFILRNTTFFLNVTSETNETITMNSTSNFTIFGSTIISNATGKAFYIILNGLGNIYNSTFNNSRIHLAGTLSHKIEKSNFYDYAYFEENTTNTIYNSLFASYTYFYNTSNNLIENCTFSYRAETYGNSLLNIKNSTFNGDYFYVRENSTVNFTLPRSSVINLFRAYNTGTVYGYIDMPNSGGIAVPVTSTLNRFYPVWINYTNGSPAVSKQLNITNNTVLLWQGSTDSNGMAFPNITWNTSTGGLVTKVNYTIATNPSQLIGILTDTPIIFQLDESPPGLNVILPQNNSFYNTTIITLNYTVWDDIAVDKCWYINVTGGTENLPSCNNITFTASEGLNNITVYVNDSSNNINSSQIFFTVDITAPVVRLENPANNSVITATNDIVFYYNVTDNIGIKNASLIINNVINQTNFTIALDTSQNFTVINMPNGQYNWSVVAYDNAGNFNTSATYNLTINYVWCGDGTCNGAEDCNSCSADCGSCDGGGNGGGGGGGGGTTPPADSSEEENITEPPAGGPVTVIEPDKKPVKESPGIIPELSIIGTGRIFIINMLALGITGLILFILILWKLYPFIFLSKRIFAEEYVIERFIREDRLKYHKKLFVTEEVYQKYKKKFDEEKKECNLRPIGRADEKIINRIRVRYDISTELARLVAAAKKCMMPRILTTERIKDDLRRDFQKIRFENPFENEH